MADQNHSFLFIPDISGFTDFVNTTEVDHSQHIISELLEIIIDANELGMTVAEIEGDAILFYRKEIPTQAEIIAQTEKMFLKFHEHLHQYNTKRICDCGACNAASHLSLKFIAHSGPINMIKVKGFEKPYGSAVIVAHRLLKNQINSSEYVLLTENLYSNHSDTKPLAPWVNWTNSTTSYDDVGELSIFHTELSELHKKVPVPSLETKITQKTDSPLVETIFINQPIDLVYKVIIDFSLRKEWSIGVNEVKYEKNRVNRQGTKHTCLINGKTIEFETLENVSQKQKLVYGERATNVIFNREILSYSTLEKKDNGTLLTFEAHFFPKGFLGKLMIPILKKSFKSTYAKNLKALKELCEVRYDEKILL